MVYYKCGKCNFIFQRESSIDACPFCEHEYVLAATEADIAEHEKNKTFVSEQFLSRSVECDETE